MVAGSLALAASLYGIPSIADGELVAVASQVSEDYVRAKLPGGSFQPETYAFGKGGRWSGTARDPSIDDLPFVTIAHAIAGPLQEQSYLPTKDPNTTRLLLMVYWGTTHPPEHASDTLAFQRTADASNAWQQAKAAGDAWKQAKTAGDPGATIDADAAFTAAFSMLAAENAQRDHANKQTASLLGYNSLWETTAGFEHTPLNTRRQDMIDELEGCRYFVILMAYDFQLMWKQKKVKLLWETRFSISEHHNEFDQQLAAMAQGAAKFFGRDSHGLVHREQSGHVDLGELKILGTVPEPGKKK